MSPAGLTNSTYLNTSSAASPMGPIYSPVILNQEWPKISRLLFIVCCSCLGSMNNGFFVAAFFVEHSLKKLGNVYLACIGLADLMVTTIVMPTAAVVLLSGEWDTLAVCMGLQFITSTSIYCYSIFFMLVSIETYIRLCRSATEYKNFISFRVGFVAIAVFMISCATSGVGTFRSLDYDYCQRSNYNSYYFRTVTAIAFHCLPFFVTSFCLISSTVRVRNRAREQTQYKRSQQYDCDYSTTSLNLTAYIFHILAWVPYIIIVHNHHDVSDTKFYNCIWIGISRSVFSSFMYSILNRSFRRAFGHLFNYCCCKSTLSSSFSNRHRRALEYKSTTGDVRVHIMHQAVNPAHLRSATLNRDMQEL